jgi:hypothetical protein
VAPTGSDIIGTLLVEVALSVVLFDNTCDELSVQEVCVDGQPLFVDDEGAVWRVGPAGSWEPVAVEASPPKVERLWPSQAEWDQALARGAAGKDAAS